MGIDRSPICTHGGAGCRSRTNRQYIFSIEVCRACYCYYPAWFLEEKAVYIYTEYILTLARERDQAASVASPTDFHTEYILPLVYEQGSDSIASPTVSLLNIYCLWSGNGTGQYQ